MCVTSVVDRWTRTTGQISIACAATCRTTRIARWLRSSRARGAIVDGNMDPMDHTDIADRIASITKRVKDGTFDGPDGHSALVAALESLEARVFPPGKGDHFAIIKRGKTIGFCHRSRVTEMMLDDPDAEFRGLTNAEYERLHTELDA